MKSSAIPLDDSERLTALARYKVVDTPSEVCFDDIALLASQICGAPIAMISLVDSHRQWFKAKIGITENETSRDIAFCGHAILQNDLLIVPDAMADSRFADNPLVTGAPHIRFYAGTPITTHDGHALGTLCVIDRVPRKLTEPQQDALRALGRQVIAQLELRCQVEERNKLLKRLEQAHTLLARLAVRDPLTDLYNRRYLIEALERELKRARRHEGSVGVIMVDLDHFKAVNDTHGHLGGDAVLCEVSRFLRGEVRGGDFVCRYGGEEFVLVLPGGSYHDTQRRAEQIRDRMRGLHFSHHGTRLGPLTLSAGVAVYPEHGSTPEAILRAADRALYRAKFAGRDRVELAENGESPERVSTSPA